MDKLQNRRCCLQIFGVVFEKEINSVFNLDTLRTMVVNISVDVDAVCSCTVSVSKVIGREPCSSSKVAPSPGPAQQMLFQELGRILFWLFDLNNTRIPLSQLANRPNGIWDRVVSKLGTSTWSTRAG